MLYLPVPGSLIPVRYSLSSLEPLPFASTAQEVAARAGALASELRVGVGAAVELWCAQPGLWAVEKPSIIHDRWGTRGRGRVVIREGELQSGE